MNDTAINECEECGYRDREPFFSAHVCNPEQPLVDELRRVGMDKCAICGNLAGMAADEIERLSTEGAAKDAAIQAMINEIPLNWCDSLLSGDGGLPVPATCPDIERFLLKLRERIVAASGKRQ